MTGPRTVADMYGTGVPSEDAPRVQRTILDGGEDYAVDVDLTPTAGVMLEALAAALALDDDVWHEWRVLAFNHSENPERRALAVRELLASEPVRRALTLRLTPEAGQALTVALDEAATEPGRCAATTYPETRIDPAEHCPRYVEDGEENCPEHSEPDYTEKGYRL